MTKAKVMRILTVGLATLAMVSVLGQSASAAESPPEIVSMSVPLAGDMQIVFHGMDGPFRIQKTDSLTPPVVWYDLPDAKVTEINDGVFLGLFSSGNADAAFFRCVSASDGFTELDGWTIVPENAVAPSNGQYYAVGESPVVKVLLLDNFAQGVDLSDLSTLSLYMYGPQETTQTVAAVKLLNASTDRSANPHHYINLLTNPDVIIDGNTITYPLKPVTDEAPGTYTIAIRAALRSDPFAQVMKFQNVQIRTATVESPIVTSAKCAACHFGPDSGKMYMHHIDPSSRGLGSWSLDFDPQNSCQACHSTDGYAAYRDASAPGGRVPDALVLRAHGVHMGSGLESNFNTNSVNGNFHDYVHVEFPADVRNCTACHADDRWKTNPSRLACGSCHDNTWFGPVVDMPAGMVAHYIPQADDATCIGCHRPDPPGFLTLPAISETHSVPPRFTNLVELELTPPANDDFYVVGEAPVLTFKLQVLDTNGAPTGVYINPTNITTETWNRVRMQVSGPRAFTVPALTTASSSNEWSGSSSYIYNDLRLHPGAPEEDDPRATRTVDSILYQLEAISNLTAGTYSVFVQARENGVSFSDLNVINFQVGTETVEKMPATSCTDCHGDTKMHGSYPFDPDLCKSCHDYENQLSGRTSWDENNWGFGAGPLSRYAHAAHYGHYLENSEDFEHIIFPMDVRNCSKCHSESTTWTENPNRLACMSCHDSDTEIIHGNLMTYDPTPVEPWSGDEWETCTVCHGKDDAHSPRAVHSITEPFVPPYLR